MHIIINDLDKMYGCCRKDFICIICIILGTPYDISRCVKAANLNEMILCRFHETTVDKREKKQQQQNSSTREMTGCMAKNQTQCVSHVCMGLVI